MKRIAFGCDHTDFILKHEMMAHLVERDVEVIGKEIRPSERIDYPHYTGQVTLAVVGGEVDGGVLICSTDIGVSMTADKFAEIHTVACSEPYSTRLSRWHSGTNVLASGSWVVGLELAEMIIGAWLDTQYEGGRRQ